MNEVNSNKNPELKRLHKIDDILYNIGLKLDFNYLYPENALDEKAKFFKDSKYNPKFIYSRIDIDFKKCYDELKKLKFKDSVMDGILKEKANEVFNLLKLFENIGKKDFTKYSQKLFQAPSKELVKKASKIIKENKKKIVKKEKVISSKSAIKKFEEIFDNLNLNWKVIERDIASKAVVVPTKRMLIIKKGKSFSMKEIKRFTVHEIYTHILRTEFGLRQPYKIFSIGFSNYLKTEEGLALYKEKKAGILKESQLRVYSARVLAINIALKGSFREVYNFLLRYFSEEISWDIAIRVKRGLSDSSQKGAFTKDALYLEGYYKVNEFIKNQSCLHLLHYGKIGINDALKIPLIEGLKNPYIILKKHFKKNINDLSILY